MRRAIFKWKKEFVSISLDIIHHSMVLSQPTSHATVAEAERCRGLRVTSNFLAEADMNETIFV
jgi:hypothetical protein